MKFSYYINYLFVAVDSKVFIFCTIVLNVTRSSFYESEAVSYQVFVTDVI